MRLLIEKSEGKSEIKISGDASTLPDCAQRCRPLFRERLHTFHCFMEQCRLPEQLNEGNRRRTWAPKHPRSKVPLHNTASGLTDFAEQSSHSHFLDCCCFDARATRKHSIKNSVQHIDFPSSERLGHPYKHRTE